MNSLIQIDANWKFILAVFVLTLFVAIFSFDMMAHWDDKKREDTRILLIGVSVFAFLVLATNFYNAKTLVIHLSIVTAFLLVGLMASQEDFKKDKPIELYILAYGSLTVLVLSLLWWYFYSETGQYVREKGKELKEYGRRKAFDARYGDMGVTSDNLDQEMADALKNEDMGPVAAPRQGKLDKPLAAPRPYRLRKSTAPVPAPRSPRTKQTPEDIDRKIILKSMSRDGIQTVPVPKPRPRPKQKPIPRFRTIDQDGDPFYDSSQGSDDYPTNTNSYPTTTTVRN